MNVCFNRQDVFVSVFMVPRYFIEMFEALSKNATCVVMKDLDCYSLCGSTRARFYGSPFPSEKRLTLPETRQCERCC